MSKNLRGLQQHAKGKAPRQRGITRSRKPTPEARLLPDRPLSKEQARAECLKALGMWPWPIRRIS